VNDASLRSTSLANVLGPAGAVGVAVFGLLLAQDSLNHARLSPLHLGGLTVSLLGAGYGGFLDRARTAWFGWISYGAILPSAIAVLGLGIPSLRVGVLPKSDRGAFLVGLVVLAVSFPAAVIARRRARSRLAMVQSNSRPSGHDA
jgi:hypothetical protein